MRKGRVAHPFARLTQAAVASAPQASLAVVVTALLGALTCALFPLAAGLVAPRGASAGTSLRPDGLQAGSRAGIHDSQGAHAHSLRLPASYHLPWYAAGAPHCLQSLAVCSREGVPLVKI